MLGEPRVERVYAFEHDDAPLRQADELAAVGRLVVDEVERAAHDSLAPEERVEVVRERLYVDAVDVLVVEVAVFVAGVARVADEVVVGREVHRHAVVDAQLRAEALRGRGLARGGAAGDEHEPRVVAFTDRVGDLRQSLHLPRLRDADHLVDRPLRRSLV